MTAVLFITPSEVSSGEAITVHHMARDIRGAGGRVRFLASSLTAGYLATAGAADVVGLGRDGASNRAAWERELIAFRPDVVVFADYPLLFLPSGTVPLADEAFVASLDEVDAELVTLDHLGYAQRPMTVYFGPPHLSFHGTTTPTLPERMAILLPCPVQAPADVPGRRGQPFRYWTAAEPDGRRTAHGAAELLVVHTVPNWAWRLADAWQLPYYRHLSRILVHLLADLPAPVRVVSVNNGKLLEPIDDGPVRVRNAAPMPQAAFERLLLEADLVLTENAVSVALGKAVCGLRPAAVLRNSRSLPEVVARADDALRRIVLEMESERMGAVFPWDVFPIWRADELDQLGVLRENALADAVTWLEVFDTAATRPALLELLADESASSARLARQEAYVQALAQLPSASEAIERVAAATTVAAP